MNFNKKISLVTGASRGIGRAIAEKFASCGIKVIGTATTEKGAQSISNYLNSKGEGLILNVNDKISIETLINKINLDFNGVDILVNNAGIINDNLLIRMKDEEWGNAIETNLTSVFRLSKAVIGSMLKKNYGRIINIGSVVGVMGNIGQVNYSAAKAGLIGFTKSLAKELASRNITVNIVSPGFIKTDITNSLSDKQRYNILKSIPMSRFGFSSEVAAAVNFLASDEAAYITGETIHVNGGLYMI